MWPSEGPVIILLNKEILLRVEIGDYFYWKAPNETLNSPEFLNVISHWLKTRCLKQMFTLRMRMSKSNPSELSRIASKLEFNTWKSMQQNVISSEIVSLKHLFMYSKQQWCNKKTLQLWLHFKIYFIW